MAVSSNPLFSVLMANYNNAKYIKESIESVINQTYNNWELIIVDDASTDKSMEILNKIKDKRIKIFTNSKNNGCGFTKHRASDLANGEILGYLDPDDTLTNNALAVMVELHLQHAKASIINSNHYICDEHLTIERQAYGACEIPFNENYLTFGKGITHFATFKKNAVTSEKAVNANFKRAVDQDLYYKLEEQGEVVFINKSLYYYRIHNKGISTLNNLSKSRYWLVRAKEDAYKRRKTINSIKNISKKELRAWWSILYATKASDAMRQNKICSLFYWLLKAIVKSPFDRHWKLKLKSIFVNTFFHSILKKAYV